MSARPNVSQRDCGQGLQWKWWNVTRSRRKGDCYIVTENLATLLSAIAWEIQNIQDKQVYLAKDISRWMLKVLPIFLLSIENEDENAKGRMIKYINQGKGGSVVTRFVDHWGFFPNWVDTQYNSYEIQKYF